MDKSNKIDRKEAIKRTALLMGGAVFAPSILGVLKGCTAQPGVNWNPVLFSNEQARLVTSLADVIIPSDDTPSASEVGVPAFIESMVNEVYTEEQRNTFINGLNKFSEDARTELQTSFVESDEEQRYEFAYTQNKNALNADPGEGAPFFLTFKELTILGFFTSETGATQALRYEPVPGKYQGCVPFEEVGRAWAT